MPNKATNKNIFRKTIIALAATSAFMPHAAYTLDLAQSPPGTVDSYVAPNVIISIDDSGSMRYRVQPNQNGSYTNGSDSSGPGYTEPDSNGLWKSDAKRINVLKYAVKKVFEDRDLIPTHGQGNTIRLAWQAMHNNGKSPNAGNVNSTEMNTNSMRLLTEAHRKNFLDFISATTPNSGTPTHKMMAQAHNYMARDVSKHSTPKNSPWAYKPGEVATPLLGCRRSYHIIMSDGGWQTAPETNEKPGNTDGGEKFTLPDGTEYNKIKPYADTRDNMVADWAFKSWSTNLQPTLYNINDKTKQISLSSEYRKAPATEKFGKDTTGTEAELEKYWNPRYDPANWPHLVTYTIGFSKAATTWKGEPNIKRPPDDAIIPFSYDQGKNGSLPDFITGNLSWPLLTSGTSGTFETKNPLDLWHSALNGRGRFYAVEQAEDLEKAFREIIGTINTQAEPDRSSAAVSGMSYEDKPVGLFITSNSPKEAWKGDIRGAKVTASGQTDLWDGKTTSSLLDATPQANRNIITWNDDPLKPGKPFRWDKLSATEQKCLNIKPDANTPADCASTSMDGLGEDRLSYIRGERSKEIASNGAFRNRQSKQGDIVNSNIWYTGGAVSNYAYKGYAAFTTTQKDRLPMIYVGGNDGMLHGFSVEDGTEKIAYIPRAVFPNLTRLSWPSFDDNHRYFVDGSPMTGDVDISDGTSTQQTPDWRTMLVGTLGAGGKGYFVLDVTNPSNFSESFAETLVVMDKTLHSSETISCATSTPTNGQIACLDHPDADIGHIFATPSTDDNNPLRTGQITLLNNNRWAVILGNGYNSKNSRPVLLIQYLDGNKELLRLPATAATATGENVTDNGLSAPRLVDINSDGRPDVVYAGDLKGNMWKFMIAAKSPIEWGVAFNNEPLFTAKGGTAGSPAIRTLTQSITAPPTVRANDRTKITGTGNNQKTVSVGGMMVAFGTGRNVTTADPENTYTQTLYSVLDNTRYQISIDSSTKLSYVNIHPGDSNTSIPAPTPLGNGLDATSKQVKLAKQVVGQYFKGDENKEASKGRDFWLIDQTSSTQSPSVDWNSQYGWYLDLPETGERLLKPMSLYDGTNILAVYTQIPAKGSHAQQATESCEASSVDEERQYLTMINIMDGKRPSVQLMDLNGDGFFDLTADKGVSRMRVVKGAHRIIGQIEHSTDYGKGDSFILARMPEQSMRPSWRQLK